MKSLHYYQASNNQTESGWLVWFMVLNSTFNNLTVVSWWSVLLVGEPVVPRENHRAVASHCQTLSHNVVSSTPRHDGVNNLFNITDFSL